MFEATTFLRVRYSETDQMGFVYYGNYATWFEVARVEALRNLGVSYKELENKGVLLPVIDYSVKYVKPATYDDEIKIITKIKELPTARIHFSYACYRGDELLTEAQTSLVFIDKASGRPIRCPQALLAALSPYFVDKV